MKVADLGASLRGLVLNWDGDLHKFRTDFASEIIKFAATCQSNKQLIEGLHLALDPSLGFDPLRILGEGSTRRAWDIGFDLVLKLERTDDLSEKEMEYRGSRKYLEARRRTSTFYEMLTAQIFPRLFPRIYGVLLSFGRPQTHPAALICQRAAPTGHTESVRVDDMLICSDTSLRITDARMNAKADPAKLIYCSFRKFHGSEGDQTIHHSNFGKVDGEWVLLDGANYGRKDVFTDLQTFLPVGLENLGWVSPEATWGWGPERALHLSQWMQEHYEKRRAFAMGGTRPTT